MSKDGRKPSPSNLSLFETGRGAAPEGWSMTQMPDLGFTIRSAFGTPQEYLAAREMANDIAKSNLVPSLFRDSPESILLAHDIALRINEPLITVLSNLAPIQDEDTGGQRLRWHPRFLIALINRSPKFPGGLKFREFGEGDQRGVQAYAELPSGDRVSGEEVTLALARRNGWTAEPDSPWNLVPGKMLHYRATEYFADIHCPELVTFIGQFSPGAAQAMAPLPRQIVEQPLQAVRPIAPAEPIPEAARVTSANDGQAAGQRDNVVVSLAAARAGAEPVAAVGAAAPGPDLAKDGTAGQQQTSAAAEPAGATPGAADAAPAAADGAGEGTGPKRRSPARRQAEAAKPAVAAPPPTAGPAALPAGEAVAEAEAEEQIQLTL